MNKKKRIKNLEEAYARVFNKNQELARLVNQVTKEREIYWNTLTSRLSWGELISSGLAEVVAPGYGMQPYYRRKQLSE